MVNLELILCSDTYFLEVKALVFFKVASNHCFKEKKAIKIYILRLFFQRKYEGVHQTVWSVFN